MRALTGVTGKIFRQGQRIAFRKKLPTGISPALFGNEDTTRGCVARLSFQN